MSGRQDKKIRREVRKQSIKIEAEFVKFVNMLNLKKRIELIWRILWKKF